MVDTTLKAIYNALKEIRQMGKWMRLAVFIAGLVLAIVCGLQAIHLIQNQDMLIASGTMTSDQWIWQTWRSGILFFAALLVMVFSILLFRRKK